jgi:5-methylcytosine-specific restriction endonuclease McrA
MVHILGGITFKTWLAVKEHTKKILAEGCRELRGKDLEFAKDLVKYHPEAEKKLAKGILSIRVGVPEYGSYFCFKLTNNENQERDFSHKKCIPLTKKNKELSLLSAKKTDLLKAYRHAVIYQTKEFWENTEPKICKICRSSIKIQVDHVIPLVTLVNRFELIHSIIEHPQMVRPHDHTYPLKFSISKRDSAIFVEKWQGFHTKEAKLQLLCQKCNLSKGSQGERYLFEKTLEHSKRVIDDNYDGVDIRFNEDGDCISGEEWNYPGSPYLVDGD